MTMRRTTLQRASLALIAMSLVGLAVYSWLREREAEKARQAREQYWDNVYARIGEETLTEPQVIRLMGSNGELAAPQGWPEAIGDIPDYWESRRKLAEENTLGQSGSFVFLVPADTRISWRIWQVSGRHKWIAVGFIYDRSLGSFVPMVAAKKSGFDETLPTD
jgi:hypothetical protein